MNLLQVKTNCLKVSRQLLELENAGKPSPVSGEWVNSVIMWLSSVVYLAVSHSE